MGHHYVPQHYLRGFEAIEEAVAIWVYDKSLHRSTRVPIKTIAQEAEFYDVNVERELSERLEGPAQNSLTKLRRRESLTTNERLLAAAYIATMMMRVPKQRAKALKIVPTALKNTLEEARATIHQWAKNGDADQSVVAARLADVERLEAEWSSSPPADVVERIRSPWPTEKIVALVDAMTWRIVRATQDEKFLTSDNPACIFEAYGIGKPESEITFPLDSETALLASWQGPRRAIIDVPRWPVAIREVNRRIVAGSDRFVFFHRNRPWVVKLAENSQQDQVVSGLTSACSRRRRVQASEAAAAEAGRYATQKRYISNSGT